MQGSHYDVLMPDMVSAAHRLESLLKSKDVALPRWWVCPVTSVIIVCGRSSSGRTWMGSTFSFSPKRSVTIGIDEPSDFLIHHLRNTDQDDRDRCLWAFWWFVGLGERLFGARAREPIDRDHETVIAEVHCARCPATLAVHSIDKATATRDLGKLVNERGWAVNFLERRLMGGEPSEMPDLCPECAHQDAIRAAVEDLEARGAKVTTTIPAPAPQAGDVVAYCSHRLPRPNGTLGTVSAVIESVDHDGRAALRLVPGSFSGSLANLERVGGVPWSPIVKDGHWT